MQYPSGARRHTSRVLAVLVGLTLVTAACSAGGSAEGGDKGRAEGPPRPGGKITVGIEAESSNWLPGTAQLASSGRNVALTFYDPLMARTSKGTVEPVLAKSLTPNKQLTEWTLTLRSGVTFHDGTDLNAQALKTIFDRYLTAKGSVLLGQLTDAGKPVKMEVVDDLTVTYVLPRPNASFPYVLTREAGWPFSPTAAKKAGKDAGLKPVGTGPFVFTSWTRDDRLVVKKNPNYWRKGRPYLDEIVFRPILDEDTRLASLLAGDLDAMFTLRQSIVTQVRDAEQDGQIQAREYIGDNTGGSLFNTLAPPVDDVRVRRALAHAVERKDLIEVVGGTGISPVMSQYFNPKSPWYSKKVADTYPKFDPEKAKQLLGEYINDPKRSDGRPVGSPVAVEYQCQPDPSLLELAQTYQGFWKKIGVKVKLKQVEQATHVASVIGQPGSQPPFKGSYMIACWRFTAEPDPGVMLSTQLGPQAHPLNFANYQHPEIDKSLEKLRTSTDFAARKAATDEIFMHLAQAVPQVYTGATAGAVALSKDLRNFQEIDLPSGNTGHPMIEGQIVYWPQLWLDR